LDCQAGVGGDIDIAGGQPGRAGCGEREGACDGGREQALARREEEGLDTQPRGGTGCKRQACGGVGLCRAERGGEAGGHIKTEVAVIDRRLMEFNREHIDALNQRHI